MPLGDRRLEIIDGLVQQLRALDFTGVVQVESHAGDFCRVASADGRLTVAPVDLPVTACDSIGMTTEEALAISASQSVAFANYVAAVSGDEASGISIRVESFGNSAPLYAYPAIGAETTAEEWNRVAQLNNRVQVRILPEFEASTTSTR